MASLTGPPLFLPPGFLGTGDLYLHTQIVAYYLGAALLGLLLGYLIWGWGLQVALAAARREATRKAETLDETQPDPDEAKRLRTELEVTAQARQRAEEALAQCRKDLAAYREGRGDEVEAEQAEEAADAPVSIPASQALTGALPLTRKEPEKTLSKSSRGALRAAKTKISKRAEAPSGPDPMPEPEPLSELAPNPPETEPAPEPPGDDSPLSLAQYAQPEPETRPEAATNALPPPEPAAEDLSEPLSLAGFPQIDPSSGQEGEGETVLTLTEADMVQPAPSPDDPAEQPDPDPIEEGDTKLLFDDPSGTSDAEELPPAATGAEEDPRLDLTDDRLDLPEGPTQAEEVEDATPVPEPTPEPEATPKPEPALEAEPQERAPEQLDAARAEGPDDLKLIKGVGYKLERDLNRMGIYHYDQIANWTEAEIAWVDSRLKFKGRIQRDTWTEQAKTLAKGEETEFSKRKKKK